MAEEQELHYGITPRPVYYMCINCGYTTSKEEMDTMPSIMCPRCGFRVFVKVRVPPAYRPPRRVYAI